VDVSDFGFQKGEARENHWTPPDTYALRTEDLAPPHLPQKPKGALGRWQSPNLDLGWAATFSGIY
jgi:hypothetical protein